MIGNKRAALLKKEMSQELTRGRNFLQGVEAMKEP
jgi:hypothetical protein